MALSLLRPRRGRKTDGSKPQILRLGSSGNPDHPERENDQEHVANGIVTQLGSHMKQGHGFPPVQVDPPGPRVFNGSDDGTSYKAAMEAWEARPSEVREPSLAVLGP